MAVVVLAVVLIAIACTMAVDYSASIRTRIGTRAGQETRVHLADGTIVVCTTREAVGGETWLECPAATPPPSCGGQEAC